MGDAVSLPSLVPFIQTVLGLHESDQGVAPLTSIGLKSIGFWSAFTPGT